MKSFTTVRARYSIYISMILPLLTHCCPMQSAFTKTQLDRFSFARREKAMLSTAYKYPQLLEKYLTKEFASDIFDNYFEMTDHSMNTRNNKDCIDYLL